MIGQHQRAPRPPQRASSLSRASYAVPLGWMFWLSLKTLSGS
jgi:hypothetical protein